MISKKPFLVVFAISIALIFLMAPVGAASHSFNPAATSTSPNYQPDPSMNTNVSWSTFYNGWTPLEYSNGTGNATLNAGTSTIYQNPISVNPAKIKTNLANTYDGINVYNASNWGSKGTGLGTGSIQTITNTSHSITYSVNETDASGESNYYLISIPTTDLPSNNIAYDYITIGGNLTGYTGMDFSGVIGNSTDYSEIIAQNGSVKTTYTGTNGIPMQNPAITEPFWFSVSLKAVNLTMGTSNILIGIGYALPKSTADQVFSATINNIGITEYPLTLGTETINGEKKIVSGTMGNAQLSTFNTSFSWKSINDNGYSVAISASPNNLTQVQNPLASGNYIEQVQYSGTFQLPSAPDLSYSGSNITFPLTVPADQIQVLTLGGTSYTNTFGNKTNGTVTLLSSVNPTQATSYYAIVEYTASQWNSISHPAGFFTYDGISYYFFIAIGAIAGILGLAGAVRHANNKAWQEKKVDNMPRRGR